MIRWNKQKDQIINVLNVAIIQRDNSKDNGIIGDPSHLSRVKHTSHFLNKHKIKIHAKTVRFMSEKLCLTLIRKIEKKWLIYK